MKIFSALPLRKYILSYIISLIITLVVLAIASIVFSFVPPYEWLIDALHDYIFVLSAFPAAFLCARTSSGKGFLTGIIAADIYILMLIILGGLIFKNAVDPSSLLKIFLLGSLSGAIGGIWGINSK